MDKCNEPGCKDGYLKGSDGQAERCSECASNKPNSYHQAQTLVDETNKLIDRAIKTLEVSKVELQTYLDTIFYEDSTESTSPFKEAAKKAMGEIQRINTTMKKLLGDN